MGLTTLLSISDLRERYLRETNCNPRRSSFLTETAESLGRATGLGTHGIRNAVNTVTLGRSSCEVHDLSLVFTGTLYNILVHALEEGYKPSWLLFCNVNERSRKQHLGKINEDLRALVLAAHCYVPYPNPSFSDFGKSMFQIVEGNEYYSYLTPYISGAFEERGISLTAPHTDSSMCDRNALQQYGVMGTRNTHICETLERFKR